MPSKKRGSYKKRVYVGCYLLFLSSCDGSALPSCDDPSVVELATQIFQKNIYKSSIAEELIDIKKSSIAFKQIETIKAGGEIKECSANSVAQITLSPGGNRAIAREDVFAAAFLKAARLPHPIRYVLRATDDRRLSVEIFDSSK